MQILDLPRPVLADVIAGVSVALVLIPQSMAYAGIAGMPPYVGLFAAAFPLLVFALFASSPYLQTGPVALTSLLTLGALTASGFAEETEAYIAAGALLALLVGLMRLLLGALRLGSVAYLVCEPVMIGFMSAAAIVILSSQLPKVFGVDPPDSDTLAEAWWAITHPGEWQLTALLLAAFTLVLMLGGRRVHRLFPGVLVAVIGCLVYSIITDYEGLIVGPVPAGIPGLSLDLPWSDAPTLLVGALVIALVGFAEPSAIARTFATEDRIPWSASRELVSSGLSNMMSGLSGAFPVGGSFSRSSVNRFAGAQTRFSGGVTGLVVLAFLPFAGFLEKLPTAALGAIVLGAVIGLVRPVRLVRLWTSSPAQAALAWITFAATLLFAPRIEFAILLGVALTVVHHFVRPLRVIAEPSIASATGGTTSHETTSRETVTVRPEGLLWIGSYKSLAARLREEVDAAPGSPDVIVDLGSQPAIDASVVDVMSEVATHLRATDRTLGWVNPPEGADALLAAAITPASQSLAP